MRSTILLARQRGFNQAKRIGKINGEPLQTLARQIYLRGTEFVERMQALIERRHG